MRRLLVPTLAVAGFLVLGAFLLWLSAGAFSRAQERVREYRYLSEALEPVERPADAVRWTPAVRPLVRAFLPEDEAMVGNALTQGWRAFAAASDTGETALLADHFAGIALSRAQLAVSEAWTGDTRMVVLEQTAQPDFLHLDGSVVQISAKATTVRYSLRDGALAQLELARDDVRTTLTNETTGWRIFSHDRSGSQPVTATPRPPLELPRLNGVNYYPANTPWRRFWPEFDAEIIAADLDLVAKLGGNAVRIFLPVADFGPDSEGLTNLEKLGTFLTLAKDRNIQVIPTLFDMKPGYRPALWADDVAYLRRVLPVLAGSPAVVIVDLKNEPDLDREAQGAGLVDAWMTTMTLMTREIAPDLPLTIGWSSAMAAPDLAGLLDAVSYHDYAPVAGTAERLADVRQRAEGKPVLVTEIGVSSYTLALGFPGSPSAQATLLGDRIHQLAPADGVLVWTLHDYEAPDIAAVGGSPWVQRLQAKFGLYDSAGAAKPAADAVAAAFSATPGSD
ncbi:MAG: glycoside hydrolase family 5 protein [Tabrizicola sp.]|jgi:hypothetical protein|nr:glycoside hydrolase family 5 protein [Tabrizicola sp.]